MMWPNQLLIVNFNITDEIQSHTYDIHKRDPSRGWRHLSVGLIQVPYISRNLFFENEY